MATQEDIAIGKQIGLDPDLVAHSIDKNVKGWWSTRTGSGVITNTGDKIPFDVYNGYYKNQSIITPKTVSADTTQTEAPPTFSPTEMPDTSLSIKADLEKQRKALEEAYQAELNRIKAEKTSAQTEQDNFTSMINAALGEAQPLTTPFRENLEASERKRLKVEENFFANQSLVNELEGLLTESIEMTRKLESQKVPGLAGLQQSERLIRAKEGVQSRIAVVQAVMSARNNQIGTALNFIDRTANAITQDRQDRLNYLNTLVNWYDKQRTEEGNKILELSKDEKAMIDKQIGLLEMDLSKTQETADYIKKLMRDPETASFMANAGVSLSDTVEQINQKIAKQASVETINQFKNEKVAEGYTYVPFPQPGDGTVSFNVGGQTLAFRKPVEKGIGGIGGGTGGKGLSPITQAVIDNPNLLNSLTPTVKGQVISELQGAGYDITGLGDKSLSDTAIKEINQTDFALTSLNDLRKIISDNENKIGPLTGLNWLNPWSEQRKILSDIDRVRQTVGKALEGGVLRKEDEEKYKKILATITDTPETAIYKIDQLINSITGNLENYKSLQQSAGRSLDIKTSLSKGQTITGETSTGNSYIITQ